MENSLDDGAASAAGAGCPGEETSTVTSERAGCLNDDEDSAAVVVRLQVADKILVAAGSIGVSGSPKLEHLDAYAG